MKFKWHWRKRQKYVKNCMIRSASQQGIDISEIRRAVNMKELPSEDIDDWRLRCPGPYLVFGDIEGKLDELRVECAKCARKGRYSVRLIEIRPQG
jgi:hypothetical protein